MPKTTETTDKPLDQLEIAIELERIRFELTERKIQVKFLTDFSGFSFEEVTIPPTSQGSRLEIPYYIAEILRRNSVIEDFDPDFPTSLQELTAAVRNELRDGKLQPLPPFTHILAKELLLTPEDQESKFENLEQKRQISKFNQLTLERISKILRMTDSKDISTRKRNLTPSEEILFNKIVSWIQSWKAEFIQK
ncbi:MAG: hypothetical protein JSV04_06930 [Candidatus Heimdallarchaeota archaeon]|nr:MAG: hypothetical protein JSV04_06930 [Candidatus Heimdallarchaeota archaeon]